MARTLAPLTILEHCGVWLGFTLYYFFFSWFSIVLLLGIVALTRPDAVSLSMVLVYATSLVVMGSLPGMRLQNLQKQGINVLLQRYFSHRVIFEAPPSTYTQLSNINSGSDNGNNNGNGRGVIYPFVSNSLSSLGLPAVLYTWLHEYFTGQTLHLLAPPQLYWLHPLFNLIHLLSKSHLMVSLEQRLTANQNVVIFSVNEGEISSNSTVENMSVKTNKQWIVVALQTGASIVPSISFGGRTFFYYYYISGLPIPLYLQIPRRSPLVTVLGIPINCQATVQPSLEEINNVHENYLREIRRLFETYKGAYDWQDKKLQFQRA
jgi:hypothetical protein